MTDTKTVLGTKVGNNLMENSFLLDDFFQKENSVHELPIAKNSKM